jgi:XTP/dITP diphosphohydrolase
MRRLVLATKNPGKVIEIKEILGRLPIEVVAVFAYKDIPEIEENGETFEENAVHKALATAKATGEVALADDSGLEVDALSGAPGVHSARFAGEDLPRGRERDKANYEKLLSLLEDVEDAERTARFKCVVAIAAPCGKVRTAEGVCEGKIAFQPNGSGGFGYDPVFIPYGHTRSFAALPHDVKNAISHRARALKATLPLIEEFFQLRGYC